VAASSRGGAQVLLSRGAGQRGLVRGEGPSVAVHEPLAGTGALNVGEQRDYVGPGGHGVILSGGRGRWWGLRQPGRVQHSDPVVNRQRSWT
jgi:hypothetical protein